MRLDKSVICSCWPKSCHCAAVTLGPVKLENLFLLNQKMTVSLQSWHRHTEFVKISWSILVSYITWYILTVCRWPISSQPEHYCSECLSVEISHCCVTLCILKLHFVMWTKLWYKLVGSGLSHVFSVISRKTWRLWAKRWARCVEIHTMKCVRVWYCKQLHFSLTDIICVLSSEYLWIFEALQYFHQTFDIMI